MFCLVLDRLCAFSATGEGTVQAHAAARRRQDNECRPSEADVYDRQRDEAVTVNQGVVDGRDDDDRGLVQGHREDGAVDWQPDQRKCTRSRAGTWFLHAVS